MKLTLSNVNGVEAAILVLEVLGSNVNEDDRSLEIVNTSSLHNCAEQEDVESQSAKGGQLA